MKRYWLSAAEALIWLWLLVLLVGCTLIAFNRAPVEVMDRDSHDAGGSGGTNGGPPNRTWDMNISPR